MFSSGDVVFVVVVVLICISSSEDSACNLSNSCKKVSVSFSLPVNFSFKESTSLLIMVISFLAVFTSLLRSFLSDVTVAVFVISVALEFNVFCVACIDSFIPYFIVGFSSSVVSLFCVVFSVSVSSLLLTSSSVVSSVVFSVSVVSTSVLFFSFSVWVLFSSS